MIFYFCGSVVGFTGVMYLVSHHFTAVPLVRTVTYVFSGVVLFFVVGAGLLGLCVAFSGGFPDLEELSFLSVVGTAAVLGWAVIVVTVLFALYTDWILAAVADDVVGVPSSDNQIFYWLYFAAKRFPMLSM